MLDEQDNRYNTETIYSNTFNISCILFQYEVYYKKKYYKIMPPGIEPGNLRVQIEHDNLPCSATVTTAKPRKLLIPLILTVLIFLQHLFKMK